MQRNIILRVRRSLVIVISFFFTVVFAAMMIGMMIGIIGKRIAGMIRTINRNACVPRPIVHSRLSFLELSIHHLPLTPET